MRVIAKSVLKRFAAQHPDARVALERWYLILRAANWTSMQEVQRTSPGARPLNAERVRFAVAGGAYRMIVAIDFTRQIAFIKFIGTHAEYDAIDALTVSQF
jgi:mRNA interferase HigB